MCKTIELKCEVCGKTFNRKKKAHNRYLREGKTSVYCSSECYIQKIKSNNTVTRRCIRCEKEFESTDNKRYKKCCSITCAKIHAQSFVDTTKISNKLKEGYSSGKFTGNRKYKPCKNCGTEYFGDKKFCCDSCKIDWLTKNNESRKAKISESRKKLFSSGILNVTGGTSKWIKYKDIKVQGTYEYRTCFILDKMLEQNHISKWGYTKERFKYISVDGLEHTYVMDFKITDRLGNVFYVETKGRVKPEDYLKWKAVKDLGNLLEVWFLVDIEKKENFYGIIAPTSRAAH